MGTSKSVSSIYSPLDLRGKNVVVKKKKRRRRIALLS